MMAVNKRNFAVAMVPTRTFYLLAALTLLPSLVVALIWASNPAEFAELPIWALILIVLIGPIIVAFSLKGVRNPVLELDNDSLRLKVSFIEKRWKTSEIDKAAASIVNLESRTELRPKWKLWGAALPGLSSGLFKLYNGQKAHVYLTDRNKVVYIPTQNGPILLSLERPKEFLAALQAK